MQISEVRVKLIENKDDRLKAFCSVTMDNEFVVRDIKIIEGTNGYFVAMPSRKMSDHCEKCGGKNHLRAKFCNNCGATLSDDRAKKDVKGRMMKGRTRSASTTEKRRRFRPNDRRTAAPKVQGQTVVLQAGGRSSVMICMKKGVARNDAPWRYWPMP